MKQADDRPPTNYQDILRAIGTILDEEGLRDVRVWEHNDGVMIQGREPKDGVFRTIELSGAELGDILQAARERRQG